MSLVALVPLLAVTAHEVFKQRAYYTGTNSVETRSLVVAVPAHGQLCIPQTEIPGSTGVVRVAYAVNGPRPPLNVSIQTASGLVASGSLGPGPQQPLTSADIPLTAALPASPASHLGTVCITPGGALPTLFGGMAGLRTEEASPTLDGKPIGSRVSLWFLPKPNSTRSLAQGWGDVMRRLTLFRPGFAGHVFYWLLFLVGLPLLGYAAIRLVAVADLRGPRRLAIGVALLAFLNAASWAVTTAAFDSPDEPEHFAYTESIVETGRAPDPTPSPRAPYAADELIALDAIRHFSQIESPSARPPWASAEVATWRARVAREHPPAGNGGGYSVATGPHSPLYYALLAPGYALGRDKGIFTSLFWMRLISALLGALVAACAFGVVRELAPSQPRIAVAAGLAVAFQPMFSFISGAVNNDNGVNAAAATLVYLLVRALRRGLTWRLALAIGIVAELLPLMKGTGYAVFPAAILAFVAIAARARSRRAVIAIGAAVGAFGLTALVWRAIASGFHRGAAPIPGGTGGATGIASDQLGGKLVYLWEVFLPRLPFMTQHWHPGQWPFYDIYVQRGFGAFGWYAIYYPGWVYEVIVAAIFGAAVLALSLFATAWAKVRARWREAIFLALVILGVIAGVESAFYAIAPRPRLAEQGRYAFTAIVPLAALAVSGMLGLPRRWSTSLATLLVTAMVALSIGAHLLYVANTYM